MLSGKKTLPFIFFSLLSVLFLFGFSSCDDSSASSAEDVEQADVVNHGQEEVIFAIFGKWDGTIPNSWSRSGRYYSDDNKNGFYADAIYNTYKTNWTGKYIYLARNFRDENQELLVEGDMLLFFDIKENNSDGYYIYFNMLPLEDD